MAMEPRRANDRWYLEEEEEEEEEYASKFTSRPQQLSLSPFLFHTPPSPFPYYGLWIGLRSFGTTSIPGYTRSTPLLVTMYFQTMCSVKLDEGDNHIWFTSSVAAIESTTPN